MSNILIIKHGSLGDLVQANGAIKDIKNFYKNRKVFLLTSKPYAIFMSECPYIEGVITDKRLPRWNLFYLNNLKKILLRYDFSRVFDSANSVDIRRLLRDIEIVLIEKALERNANNTSEAAKDLHLQRTTLIEKIKKYGL